MSTSAEPSVQTTEPDKSTTVLSMMKHSQPSPGNRSLFACN